MGDLVRHKIFGYPRTASPEDNKWRLLPPEQGGVELVDPKHPPADRHPRIILRPNDYPYHLEGVCGWAAKGVVTGPDRTSLTPHSPHAPLASFLNPSILPQRALCTICCGLSGRCW